MQKNKTTNGFGNGINLDLNPLLTPNTVMTNALNATLVTMNGNEQTLLNDMGNGRVETAYLPEGFIPLGSAELGGIIYIVSYNPLIDRCLIGSFPSPERNITSKELDGTNQSIEEESLYSNNDEINSPYTRLELTDFELNPGDKYVIVCPAVESAKTSDGYSYISALGETYYFNSRLLPRYLRFSVVAISSNGQVIDMSDSCVWLKLLNYNGYYILNTTGSIDTETGKVDLDEYRDLVTSQYNVFSCKHSGKLGILAQFECIDTFEIAWDALKIDGKWNFYFYTNWTYENDLEPDKINLFGIRYSGQTDEESVSGDIIIENYPILYTSVLSSITGDNLRTCVVTTDIMGDDMPEGMRLGLTSANKLFFIHNDYYNFEFLTPYYIEDLPVDYLENGIDPYSEKIVYDEEGNIVTDGIINNGNTLSRKNDGSDNQFLICDPVIVEADKGIFKLNIKPLMPYGALNWLELNFTIDLSKLGSGIIDLVEYRYYILNGKVTLNWGLDAYPERNRKINGVTFNFYKIGEYSDENESCNIIDWIENNLYTLDYCKVINDTWIDLKTEKDASKETFSVYNENGDELEEGYICHYFPEIKDCGSIKINGYTELPDYCTSIPFETSSKSSYSGHFTEDLIIYEADEVDNPDEYLIDGKTYLLEIDVNYNDTDIKYYRIFYTLPIFNKYFYDNDYIDYAKIDLEPELGLLYEAKDINIDNTTHDIIIREAEESTPYDEDLEELSGDIPSYQLEENLNGYYHIDNNYTVYNLSFRPDCKSLYDLFNISVNEVNNPTITINSEVSDLNKVPFNNTRSTRSDWPIKDPYGIITLYDYYYSDGIVHVDYDCRIHNPIKLIYDTYEIPKALYLLSELKYQPIFLCGSGSNYSAEIWVSDFWEETYDGSSARFNTSDYKGSSKSGDDLAIDLNLKEMAIIYDELENRLNGGYDILLIGCIENHSNNYKHAHNEGRAVEFGTGKIIDKDFYISHGNTKTYKNYRSERYINTDDTSEKGGLILCYAIKTETSVILFTLDNMDASHSGKQFNWFDITTIEWYDLDNFPTDYCLPLFKLSPEDSTTKLFECPIDLDTDELNIDIAFAPFKDLRKLVTTAKEAKPIYRFSTAYYYDKFTETENINLNGDIDIKLFINTNVEVKAGLLVKNLHYTTGNNETISYGNSRRIDNTNLIDPVTSYSDYFVVDKYGNIVGNSGSINTLIKVEDNGEIENIKKIYNSIPCVNGDESALSIARNNQSEYIQVSGIPSDRINILWAYEEQAVAIKNIYII